MSRHGGVLIEVLVALAILSSAGVSTVVLLTAHARAQAHVQESEEEVVQAERLLAASALLTRAELDQRLGTRVVRGFEVAVSRPESELYRIAVARPGGPEVLVTVVHRREEAHAPGS